MKDPALYENIPSLENNFTVKFRLYKKQTALLPHWHEHIEMLYIRDGVCEFVCDGKQFSARTGDLVVVNSTEIHSFSVENSVEYFSILLYPAFFSDIVFEGVLIKNLICDRFIGECMSDIYQEYAEGKVGSDMMLKSYTYKLMAYLVRGYTASIISARDFEARKSKLKRLNTVIEYISENYSDKITTRQLAAMCFLSEAHFCRFFKGAMGKSATEYINGYRVEKATVLLRNTDATISKIASDVGFDDINYFSRIFKNTVGVSPGKYRAIKD